VFQQTSGLVEGGEVVLGGVKVGKVDSITLGPDGLPRVRMRLTSSVDLREGTMADLRVFSNSGEVSRYVALLPGNGPRLADGATIAASQTDNPIELDHVLNTLNPQTRSDLRQVLAALDDGSDGLESAYRQSLRASGAAFDQTGAWLEDLSSDDQALRTLVSQGASLTAKLAEQREPLQANVTELARTLDGVAGEQRAVADGIAALPAGLASQTRALRETRAAIPDVRRLLLATAPVARQLRSTARNLRPALLAARPALVAAERLFASAPSGLRALSRTLRDIAPVARELAPVADALVPTTNYVRTYMPELIGFLSSWASMTSNYDANGHAIRITAVGTATPVGDVDAATGSGAGYLKAPFVRVPGQPAKQPWVAFRDSFLSSTPRGRR
jgi:phospholipid/cholesterol/gamma-HCH transport system substrate-binding protein